MASAKVAIQLDVIGFVNSVCDADKKKHTVRIINVQDWNWFNYFLSSFPVPLLTRTQWLKVPPHLVSVATRPTPSAGGAARSPCTSRRKPGKK